LPFYSLEQLMRKSYRFFRFVIFTLCLSLAWPITAAPVQKKKSRKSSKKKSSRAPVPTKSFDEMIGSTGAVAAGTPAPGGRVMFSEMGDSDQAVARIDENSARAHVKFLSDDLLEGRGTGSRGGLLAAKYIAAQFEAAGLEPAAPDHSYFQQVQMVGTRTDPSSQLVIKTTTGEERFSYGDQFVAGTDLEEPSINIISEIVFVGYGIQAPEYQWDDYKGLDVRGKVVMILVNDPPATAAEPNLFGGKALTYYGRWTYKYEEAARRGASGVILVHTNESASYGWNVVRNSWGGEQFGLVPEANTPVLRMKAWVTDEVATQIVKAGGLDLAGLRLSAVNRSFQPVSLTSRVDMTLKVTSRRIVAPNVAAVLRGSDPNLKNEFVVFTAHWDHLGMRPDQAGDNVYNGAVDNATGIAGLIGIGDAFSALSARPKRSIIFLATTAEEQGLLGSEYYTRHPLVPLDKTVANINLDSMNVLGPTTDISPLGADRSSLGKVITAVAAESQVTLSGDPRPERGSFYRSDHFPFAKVGVPAVSFNPGTKFVGHSEKWGEDQFREYNETRYHQPADEFSPSWDLRGLVQQGRLAFLSGVRVANAVETPKWNDGDEFAKARQKK
jgi:Zn-dependent M28 family amino/carboxypeptidase